MSRYQPDDDAKQVEMIAHRGFSAIAPENTLAAFSAAIQHQADSIEFDVQLSADRVPIIIHDSTVDRTTNGTGKVQEKTLEQLKALDAGSWFHPQFSAEKIPTLAEALNQMQGLQFIYAEVKQSENWSTADIQHFIQTLMREGGEDRCIVACFNHGFLEEVRNQFKNITLGYLVYSSETYRQALSKVAADANAVMLSKYEVFLADPLLVQDTRKQKVDVGVWTVDNPEDCKRLTEIGVMRIVTNSLIGLPNR